MNFIYDEQSNRQAFIDSIYPVGSVYISINNTNPADIFGGVWNMVSEGLVPISAGTGYVAGQQYGQPSVTLTREQMPVHNHGSDEQYESGSSTGSTGSAGSHSHVVSDLAPYDQGNWWAGNVHAGSKSDGNCGYPGYLGWQNENHGGWKYLKRPATTSSISSSLRDKNWHSVDSQGAHTHTIPRDGGKNIGTAESPNYQTQPVDIHQPSMAFYMWIRVS